MPRILYPENGVGLGDPKLWSERTQALGDKDFHYAYPLKGGTRTTRLKLKPGTDFHDELVKEVLFRASEAHHIMQRKFDIWNKITDQLEAYIPKDEEEIEIEDEDRRKPTSTVVPAMFTYLDTLLTHTMSLSLDYPVFRFAPGGPEDLGGVLKLEAVIAHQTTRAKMPLNLHTWWRDAFCYGLGVLASGWEKRTGPVTVREEVPDYDIESGVTVGSKFITTLSEQVLYEGNFLTNISPYVYLPDPCVPIHEVQRGEFVGYVATDNLMSILGREFNDNKSEDAVWFNGKYLKGLPGRSAYFVDSDSPVADSRYDVQERVSHPIDVIHMYITLIPKDWELGSSEKPEKWVFSLANDRVIIRAQPLNLDHDMYPVAICAPDFDGYKVTPTSRMEAIWGLQHATDWLLNSHIRDQRKNVHGRYIVDPQQVMMGGLEDPDQSIIYLRPSSWGRNPKDAIFPLPVNNVTQVNVANMSALMNIMQEATGAQSPIQGTQRQGGERVTAREVGVTSSSALGRITRAVEVGQLQGMQDLAFQLASNTKQLLTESTYVSIVGRMEDDLNDELRGELKDNNNRLPVSPLDLNVGFDVVMANTVSSVREMSGEQMAQYFQVVAGNEELSRNIDMYRWMRYIFRQLGFRNLPDFERKQQLPPGLPLEAASSAAGPTPAAAPQLIQGGG